MNFNKHMGERITKKTFYKEYLPLTIKYYIYLGVIILFLSAIINSIQIFKNPYIIGDVLILLGLGLATLLTKSRSSSTATLIYIGIAIILGFYEGQIAIGILPLIAVIASAVGTFRYHKLWIVFNENPQLFNEICREYIVRENKHNNLKKYRKNTLIILGIILAVLLSLIFVLMQFADNALSFAGELSNNLYKNEYANISVTIPDEYIVASEEKKEEDLGTSNEYILYDLYGYNEETYSDFDIMVENTENTESEYLENLQNSYSNFDYSYSFEDKQTVNFAGEEYLMVNMKIGEENGSPLYIRYYVNEFEEDYMAVISISSFEALEINRVAACFSSME